MLRWDSDVGAFRLGGGPTQSVLRKPKSTGLRDDAFRSDSLEALHHAYHSNTLARESREGVIKASLFLKPGRAQIAR